MNHRLMLAGRVAGDPLDIGASVLATLAVPNGPGSTLWAVLFDKQSNTEPPFAEGDVVAVVGVVDPTRKSPGGLNGPLMADALLGLGANGAIFGR